MGQVTLLLVLAFVALCFAQTTPLTLSNPKLIYPTPNGTQIKTITAATTTCSATIVVLDNSTECLKYLTADGVIWDWACDSVMAQGIDVLGYASAGYLWTASGQYMVLNMYNATAVYDLVGPKQTLMSHPWKGTLYTSYAVPTLTHNWYMLDGATNSSLYYLGWTISSTNATSYSYSSNRVGYLNNTVPVKLFFTTAGSVVMIVYEGDNTIVVWNAAGTGAATWKQNITGFGQIAAAGGDYYNRAWVFDLGCSCIKVMTQAGVIQATIAMPQIKNPHKVQATRNKVFVWDDAGIWSFDYPALSAVWVAPPDAPCITTTVSTGANVQWGSPPYVARVIPDQIIGSASSSTTFTYSWATKVGYRVPYTRTYDLYRDSLSFEFQAAPVSGGVSNLATPSSVIPPYEGLYSWSMLMANNYQYAITPSSPGASISASFFATLSMWLNVGSGIGHFRIDLSSGSSYNYVDYYPGDLPRNQWTQVFIDLSMGPLATYPRIVFADYSGWTSTNTYLYVDDIVLLPYNTSGRYLAVRDFCNVTVYSPYYAINSDNFLQANVVPTPATCSASSDASLTASATGGTAPYKYAWSFTTSTNTTLDHLSASLNTDYILYDNSIDPIFADDSTGVYSLNDTTYYNSYPYSISMLATGVASNVVLYTKAGFSSNQYQSIEFYVNGGDTGNQLIYVGLIQQFNLVNQQLIHKLLNLPSIPADEWLKVTLPIPAGTYYGVAFRGFAGVTQPTIYFDDIRLINVNSLSLTVTDNAGCVSSTHVTVESPAPLSVVPSTANVKCYNVPTGSISLDVTGGSSPYTYNWAGHNYADSASSLAAGTYPVSVTDAYNCAPASVSVQVLQPPPLTVTIPQNPQCGSNLLTARASGGTPTYTFSWARSSSALASISQPAPLALFTDSFHLAGSFQMSLSATVSVVCGGENGTYPSQAGLCALLVAPSSSTQLFAVGCTNCIDFSKFTYISLWINVLNSGSPSLSASFTSGNGQLLSQALNISSTPGWQLVTITLPATGTADYFTISHTGSTNSFLIDTIELGVAGATSSGSNVASSYVSTVDSSAGGSYSVSVYDGNNCPVVASITIPPALNATWSVSLTGSSRASITISITGGTAPYSVWWPTLQQKTTTVKNIGPGTYTVIITDNNGCQISSTQTIGDGSGHIGSASLLLPSLIFVVAVVALL